MLTALHIENFALIDQLDLDLQAGLNVLTGETGAGKSIILDAIDAVLGGKASQRLVRTGAKRAVVEAHFAPSPSLTAWLTHQRLPAEGDTLVCSRELTRSKTSVRSRSRINGVQVNRPQLEELRPLLVEITAQGQTVQLGSADRQRDWLDGFGATTIQQQRQQVAAAYDQYRAAQRALQQRRQAEQERREKLDLLQMHWDDLSAANLTTADELEDLQQEQHRLSHSVELQQQSYQLYQILYENETGSDACADLLGKAEGILADMERYDRSVTPMLALVSAALAQVQEAGSEINRYGDSLEADPQRLEEVEQRIRQLKGLVRRYGRPLDELIPYRDQVQATLEGLTDEGQSIDALEAAVAQTHAALEAACTDLSALRREAADRLEALLVAELKPLAMEQVQFQVALSPVPPSATGADRVQFLFSPNPGEPLQPLAETASGGEMSRFLLALKACFSQIDPVGTLVFDEIDVGVSGRVAQAIAEKLYQLGAHHQVLCVTHQPMVAALADAHYRVGKQVVEAVPSRTQPSAADPDSDPVRTVVRVASLAAAERREELAQLAGGQSHRDSLSFADALLAQASRIRR